MRVRAGRLILVAMCSRPGARHEPGRHSPPAPPRRAADTAEVCQAQGRDRALEGHPARPVTRDEGRRLSLLELVVRGAGAELAARGLLSERDQRIAASAGSPGCNGRHALERRPARSISARPRRHRPLPAREPAEGDRRAGPRRLLAGVPPPPRAVLRRHRGVGDPPRISGRGLPEAPAGRMIDLPPGGAECEAARPGARGRPSVAPQTSSSRS